MIEMIPVSSSNIKAIGYDAGSLILQIEFHDESIYQYSGVPESEFRAFMASGSKGVYANQNIFKRYQYMKIK